MKRKQTYKHTKWLTFNETEGRFFIHDRYYVGGQGAGKGKWSGFNNEGLFELLYFALNFDNFKTMKELNLHATMTAPIWYMDP